MGVAVRQRANDERVDRQEGHSGVEYRVELEQGKQVVSVDAHDRRNIHRGTDLVLLDADEEALSAAVDTLESVEKEERESDDGQGGETADLNQ